MNPAPRSTGLKLNVSETDNALDLELALSVAHLFRLRLDEANAIITQVRSVVGQWRSLANGLGISRREQEMYAPAFRLAD
jgi:serine/threonine-protein kinase HipA